ncbi:hypothetical protein EVAR_75971_1 [Eumeta japonica]|uniref:Uncharacterized protein n=1 Tax=Eumeta variegata TaxID=151549 RepID=A0A4C1UAC2_EUMVA|nr:hypothetical protein EVAR_75971_1 [Eumeta japonica]
MVVDRRAMSCPRTVVVKTEKCILRRRTRVNHYRHPARDPTRHRHVTPACASVSGMAIPVSVTNRETLTRAVSRRASRPPPERPHRGNLRPEAYARAALCVTRPAVPGSARTRASVRCKLAGLFCNTCTRYG